MGVSVQVCPVLPASEPGNRIRVFTRIWNPLQMPMDRLARLDEPPQRLAEPTAVGRR